MVAVESKESRDLASSPSALEPVRGLPLKQMLESEGSNSFCPVQTHLSILVGEYNKLREALKSL